MQLSKFAGYVQVDETKDFAILLNSARPPIEAWKDKDIANYLLVYKNRDTVEAESDSIVVAMQYLQMAQKGFDDLLAGVPDYTKPASASVAH